MARVRTKPTKPRLRSTVAAVAAIAAALGGVTAITPMAQAATPAGAVTPLSPELEAIRAAEATKIYGDSAIRPLNERKTGLISLGDSEISGEGVGNYDPATNTSANQCHRSPDSAIHRTGIPADLTFNVACSGGYTGNIKIGGSKQYADELVQSDSLAIKARNTKIKMVLLVAGANDDLQFGPVMTDCVTRWVLSQGTCEPKYSPGWQARVDGLKPKVESTVADLKTVMRDAGYADSDYKLVVMGYPSPIGPDFYDNPNFPGKLPGGCAGYDSDATWGRNYAVPTFEKGMRAAALASGATYLDNSRLFHGHEVCMEDTWARGLYLDLGDHFPWDENTARQSFHPNYRGHGAFASCLTQLYDSGLREASCADPASTGTPVLQAGAWDSLYAPLKNEATGNCLDSYGGSSANETKVVGWDCHGGRNQGWWYDSAKKSVHIELTHDRCLDAPGANYGAGTGLILWNCHGGANQQFVRDGATLHPAAAPGMCLTVAAAHEPLRLQTCNGSANQRFV
ncbi:ricin-type beta-trefoil lectin domain protein [Streptomyces sp. APSN-46.1]|uniref:ricin-type beta-trefoil lectin domain protein n=1 Tax=Streptomyces sp. APSN-46.1 TaxID=2929049 RepID=UPI001FB3ADAE|nr:ricin-type beta-trefoil lectin domain protein [Streptomyces sp. APSN-46.1]MCJ1677888.1 ricin-type beta-trefoil lectin domain protein [Streptomyces sp. APSN-46.1]